MIEVAGLTKRHGRKPGVEDLTFTAAPGAVTGLVGPDGAGKSTTMRMVVGLDRPDAGEVRIAGTRYQDLPHPLRTVGAVLDARWVHRNRSARAHLRWMVQTNRLPAGRVDEVLDLVGLTDVADQRAGRLPLGMRQRLGIAGALLGDPEVLVLDEPFHGLDAAGIWWARGLLRSLAADGRTVLVSIRQPSEIVLSTAELVVLDQGRLVAHGPTAQLVSGAADAVHEPAPATPAAAAGDQRAGGRTRALVAAERTKLFSTRSPWWLSALPIAIVVGLAGLALGLIPATVPIRFSEFAVLMGRVATKIGIVAAVVMAALAVTTEYSYSTIRTTFQAVPGRTAALLAKTTVVALTAGAVGLVTAFGTWALVCGLRPYADLAIATEARWRGVVGVAAASVIAAVLAVAVGILVRRTVVALIVLLTWVLVVENAFWKLPAVAAWLPFANADRFLAAGNTHGTGGLWVDIRMLFGPWGSLAYAAGVAAVALAVALAVANRRDA